MQNTSFWQEIAYKIERTTQQPFKISQVQSVSGGDINAAYVLYSEDKSYFIKLNQTNVLFMFEAEFAGLNEIIASHTITAPQPLICGVNDDKAFIVMENISLSASTPQSDRQLGQKLAVLHQQKQDYFGWYRDNTIGSTPQINTPSKDWVSFWQKNRLGFQLKLAETNGYSGKIIQLGEELTEYLHFFFEDYKPFPSLLHGDLWAGNAAVTPKGQPIIYDPACYYGDRETDIAMTELFGGYSKHFYNTYSESYPLHAGYSLRKTLYNLYHILNHLNLFGGSYRHQAQNMIESLLSEIK